MANKHDIQVIINDKVYTLSGYEGEDYLQKVALYLNNKISECKAVDQYKRMNTEYQNILLSLNIADDYFKSREKVRLLESEVEKLEKLIYDLKHEKIELQVKEEAAQKLALEYREQVNKLQQKMVKIEIEKSQKSHEEAK